MLRTCLFSIVLFFVLYSTGIAQTNDDRTDHELRKNHLALKASSTTHTGFFYGRQIDDKWMLGGGGYYFFDSDDGSTESVFEIGFELQYSLRRSGGFNLYALTGFGIHREKDDFFLDGDWFQTGIGIGISNQSSSGFTINLDGGILRYRNYSGGESGRKTVGFGLGIALGYKY